MGLVARRCYHTAAQGCCTVCMYLHKYSCRQTTWTRAKHRRAHVLVVTRKQAPGNAAMFSPSGRSSSSVAPVIPQPRIGSFAHHRLDHSAVVGSATAARSTALGSRDRRPRVILGRRPGLAVHPRLARARIYSHDRLAVPSIAWALDPHSPGR